MIRNKKLSEDKLEADDLKVGSFKLSKDAEQQVFQMFTDDIYSDPIGTVVREITSNAVDAQIEKGNVEDPVIVEIKGDYISIVDQGVGLSPDRFENMYSSYFASSKNTSNDEIGGFGIGAKSPLAYTDQFWVSTKNGGILYNYLIVKGEQAPEYVLLGTEKCDENDTGTTVKVPIKSGHKQEFKSKIETQLRYFDNVVVIYDGQVQNEGESIIKFEHFIINTACENDTYSLCLGPVRYDIPESIKNKHLWSYNRFHLALRFDIGELMPTASRESIRVNNEVEEKIDKKIKLAKEEVNNLALEIINSDDFSIFDFYNMYTSKTIIYKGFKMRTYDLDFRKKSIMFNGESYSGEKIQKLLEEELFYINNINVKGSKRRGSWLQSVKGKRAIDQEDLIKGYRPQKVVTYRKRGRLKSGIIRTLKELGYPCCIIGTKDIDLKILKELQTLILDQYPFTGDLDDITILDKKSIPSGNAAIYSSYSKYRSRYDVSYNELINKLQHSNPVYIEYENHNNEIKSLTNHLLFDKGSYVIGNILKGATVGVRCSKKVYDILKEHISIKTEKEAIKEMNRRKEYRQSIKSVKEVMDASIVEIFKEYYPHLEYALANQTPTNQMYIKGVKHVINRCKDYLRRITPYDSNVNEKVFSRILKIVIKHEKKSNPLRKKCYSV